MIVNSNSIFNGKFVTRRIPNDFYHNNEHQPEGELKTIDKIIEQLGLSNGYFVEIGASNDNNSNTTNVRASSWDGLRIDGNPNGEGVVAHYVSNDNIVQVLNQYNVPKEFDFLSIDIDGQDYWVLKGLLEVYSPTFFCAEVNCAYPTDAGYSVPCDPSFRYQHNDYFGMNLRAVYELAIAKDYKLVTVCNHNAFFVRNQYEIVTAPVDNVITVRSQLYKERSQRLAALNLPLERL